MPDYDKRKYTVSQKKALHRRIVQLISERRDLSITAIAAGISSERSQWFDRMNITRLGEGTLRDATVDVILQWLKVNVDEGIELSLLPDRESSLFGDAMNAFFFLPAENEIKRLLSDENFPRILICDKIKSIVTYLPPSHLENNWEKYVYRSPIREGLSDDQWRAMGINKFIVHYINSRRMIMLKPRRDNQFYAREVPLAYLYDERYFEGYLNSHVHEGIMHFTHGTPFIDLRDRLTGERATHRLDCCFNHSLEDKKYFDYNRWVEIMERDPIDKNTGVIQLGDVELTDVFFELPNRVRNRYIKKLKKLTFSEQSQMARQNKFINKSSIYFTGGKVYEPRSIYGDENMYSYRRREKYIYLPRELSMIYEYKDHFPYQEIMKLEKLSELIEWMENA